jgi:hypothetical protein
VPGLEPLTVSAALAEWLPDAAEPLTVSVALPAAALELAAMVRVALWPAEIDAGLSVAVTPEGAPLAERLMVWALPEVTAVETV